MIDLFSRPAQQNVKTPVAEAWLLLGQFDQPLVEVRYRLFGIATGNSIAEYS